MLVAGLGDLGGDTSPELGLLRVEPAGTTVFEVFDPLTRKRLAKYPMAAVEDGRGLVMIGDLNGNTVEDFVVLGEHFGTDLLEIRDCAEGTALRFYAIP
jgi:hypothetical protein